MAVSSSPIPPPLSKRRAIGELFGQGFEVLRTAGPGALAGRALGLLGYLDACWFRRGLDPPPAAQPDGLAIEELAEDGLPEYAAWRPELGFEHLGGRLAAGARCALVRWDGRPAASAWLSLGWAYVPFLRRRLELDPAEAYLFDLFTAPERRRSGLQKTLLADALRAAVARGASSMVALVESHNRPSCAFFHDQGFAPSGRLRCLRLPGARAVGLGRARIGAPAARPLAGDGAAGHGTR